MNINDCRFYATYVASLPDGLNSYPSCMVKAPALEPQQRKLAEVLGRVEDVPEPVLAFANGTLKEEWMPDVIGNCAMMLIRDLACQSDEEFMQFSHASASEVFSSKLYRMLMRVMSPTLLAMGASKRWGAFRRGTELASSPAERMGARMALVLTLRYPSALYHEILLQSFGAAFQAAFDQTSAADIQWLMQPPGDGETKYQISWKA